MNNDIITVQSSLKQAYNIISERLEVPVLGRRTSKHSTGKLRHCTVATTSLRMQSCYIIVLYLYLVVIILRDVV